MLPLAATLAPYLPRDHGGPATSTETDVPWRAIVLVGLALVAFYTVDTAAATWGPVYLDDVFDELARASNARDRPGSGLGLALVRTIVRRHGGAVTIASREGQGTRVRIELPAAG